MTHPTFQIRRAARHLAGALLLGAMALGLASCISISPSPTYIVPPGANVVCGNGAPAVFSNGAYRC